MHLLQLQGIVQQLLSAPLCLFFFFDSVFKYVRTRYDHCAVKKKNLLKDHITHNGICMIIALLGILIIHAARSASPPTSWRGVRARLGTMSLCSAAAHCI